MIFLIDTNVLIPLEPATSSDEEAISAVALDLHREAAIEGHKIFVHPASRCDINNDTNEKRRRFRELHFNKYPLLQDPPKLTESAELEIGAAKPKSNDWVDNQLIAAVVGESVDFLISEDRKIRAKAKRLEITERVLSVLEALSLIHDLAEKIPEPPPAVIPTKAHGIPLNDPILDSFRKDYQGFDTWFAKCRREHRQAWIISGSSNNIAGFCIINPEQKPPKPLKGRVLKLCSFKVSAAYNGFRFGELLLKAVFEHAYANCYDYLFLTVFEKYGKLLELFESFGFEILDKRTDLNEYILWKLLVRPTEAVNIDPLEYHIRYGPKYFLANVDWYVVPIQPKYSNLLFPETAHQSEIFPGINPFGNSIRKAYLCHSHIKSIIDGSGLIFYRSHFQRGAVALGIVEKTLRSQSVEEIARSVGKRTVYNLSEIRNFCDKEVLTILFRQAKTFHPEVPRSELIKAGILRDSPQSIMSVKEKGGEWLKTIFLT
jgi:ribosomal protein S18 acetylase RimI-like enzyme